LQAWARLKEEASSARIAGQRGGRRRGRRRRRRGRGKGGGGGGGGGGSSRDGVTVACK